MIATQPTPTAPRASRAPAANGTRSGQGTRSASSTAGGNPPAVAALDLPMRFVAIGLGALALLAVTYPWHLPLLQGSFYAPHLLAFVHVNTLGLIAAVMIGASYQLAPIVLQAELASPRLGRLSWWLYLPGVVLFVAGLGHGLPAVLGLGGTLVYAALVLYTWVIGRTLARAPARGATWWAFAVATTGLIVGASLGLLLALSKQVGFLAGLTLPTLAAHVVLMLGGWVTPLLTGVAVRLVSMFALSEDRAREDWAVGTLVLTAGGAWLLAAGLLLGLGTAASVAGAGLLLGGVVLFALHAGRLYRGRARRGRDVHLPYLLVALASGVASAGLVASGLAAGRSAADPLWIAAGWLALVGWVETAILGFLYKIGPFLTWLHRYAPIAGRQRVPMLESLYRRRLALVGWASWTLGVAVGTLVPFTVAESLAGNIAIGVASAGLGLGATTFLVNALLVGRHWFGLAGENVSRAWKGGVA